MSVWRGSRSRGGRDPLPPGQRPGESVDGWGCVKLAPEERGTSRGW